MTGGLDDRVWQRITQVFDSQGSVRRVKLYGSRAKGTYKPGSDIDLVILDSPLSLSDLLRLEAALDDLMLPWSIDLCLWEKIENPDLRAHIERVGVEVYTRAG